MKVGLAWAGLQLCLLPLGAQLPLEPIAPVAPLEAIDLEDDAVFPLELNNLQIFPNINLEDARQANPLDPYSRFRGNQQLERAALKTDSDSQVLLDSASDLAKQGRFDLASELWQKVIDQSHDLLFTKPEWVDRTLTTEFHTNDYQTYLSVVADMEGTLSKLPKEGLETYRLRADGQAKALLRHAKNEEQREAPLAEIVRRYFLSSIGDEAAFELACIKFERQEFFPASRLFTKILREYPDPTVAREAVELRLAGALARTGAGQQAQKIMADLRKRENSSIPSHVLAAVAADVDRASGINSGAMLAVAREAIFVPTGTSPAPGGLSNETSWSSSWTQGFALTLPKDWPTLPQSPKKALPPSPAEGRQTTAIRRGGGVEEIKMEVDPGKLWLAGFPPVGQMLLAKDLAFFKVEDRLVCARAATGQVEWLGFRNSYIMDSATQRMLNYPYYSGEVGQQLPRRPEDFFVQVDHVNQSLTQVEDSVYCLQGEPLDYREKSDEAPANPAPNGQPNFGGFGNEPNDRARQNRLVAYHVHSGKIRWSIGAEGLNKDLQARKAGFSGPPAPYGGALLVAVHEDSALCIYAVSRDSGSFLWRTYLCDEPNGVCNGMSPVALSIDGGDVYVASGAGLIFSVDAISGTINWATSYPRPMGREAFMNQRNFGFSNNRASLLDGWKIDQIAARDEIVVAAPSDFNHLVALDRRSGRLAWDAAKVPAVGEAKADYLLGVDEQRVYVAGKNIVRAYKVRGGKLLWDTKIEDSLAKGLLAKDAIYVPGKSTVTKLDLATGKILASMPVDQSGGQPVGNLFSDGQRLYAAGLKQVIAFEQRATEPAKESTPK